MVLAAASAVGMPSSGWSQAPLADPPLLQILDQADALRATDADGRMPPPDAAWTPVRLPDRWSDRWKSHDGAVWYRLQWQEPPDAVPVPLGILLPKVFLSAEVRLNGALLAQPRAPRPDRVWIDLGPRHWLVAPPLLRPGTNTLLLRVEGLAAYRPGISAVEIGDPALIAARWRDLYFERVELRRISQTVCLLGAGFFLALWIFWRRERLHGWLAICSLVWWGNEYNGLAESSWPFASIEALMTSHNMFLLALAYCLSTLMLRLAGLRWTRAERVLSVASVLGILALAVARPPWLAPTILLTLVVPASVCIGALTMFLLRAVRRGSTEHRLIALAIVPIAPAGVHDLLEAAGVVRDDTHYLSAASAVLLTGIVLALAWRFGRSLWTVQDFSTALRRRIDEVQRASVEAGASLSQMEQEHARRTERVRLAQDLHDGLGGTLREGISALERSTPDGTASPALTALQQVQSELRRLVRPAAEQAVPPGGGPGSDGKRVE